MMTYEQSIELFPTLSRDAYDAWAVASAKADEALRVYEVADEAVLAAFRRVAHRAERQDLETIRDDAGAVHERACAARDALAPQ